MHYQRNFYEIRSNQEIFKDICKELNHVGYYRLPFQDTSKIKAHATKITQKNIIIVGIGGSILGTKAIYTFLKTSRAFQKKLIFLDTIDPLEVNYLLGEIKLEDSHFIVISKSGDTIEPISLFKYLDIKIDLDKSNLTIITGKDSLLDLFSQRNDINCFYIDENVGGRFSVFSPVGLLPLASVGVDIDALLDGCKEIFDGFFDQKNHYEHIIKKARFLVENKSRFTNNIVFSYSSIFKEFNSWYIQLWAESLGKINSNGTRQGLTPIALLGPDDQHSFLQLIIDGVRNKTVTFIKVKNLKDKSIIPHNNSSRKIGLDFIEKISFNDLINMQADSTYEAIIQQKDIPCDLITLESVDERNIAMLMYRFQLIVSCIGAFLQINTYNQPAVELGKDILKSKLKK